jgi:hypothetical protein
MKSYINAVISTIGEISLNRQISHLRTSGSK